MGGTFSNRLEVAVSNGFSAGTIPAQLTRTSIVLLAVLGGYDLKPFSPGLFSAVLAGTGAFIYIASVYGDAFGLEFAKKTSLKAQDYMELMANPGIISALLPWLLLSRIALSHRRTQKFLVGAGIAAIGMDELASSRLQTAWSGMPELADLATTAPIPPTPFYFLAGIGAACTVIGMCLLAANTLERIGVLKILAPCRSPDLNALHRPHPDWHGNSGIIEHVGWPKS